MTTFTEGRHAGEFLLSEAPGNLSRDNAVVAVSQTIKPGTVLAKKAVVADVVATASADAGNTASSGTIAMDATAVTSAVKDGRYIGVATAATKVEWEDPTGKPIGVSTHGALFNKGGIRLTITAGGTPNVAGDRFYVDVAANSEDFQFVAFNQDGTDGSEIASAIALYGITTPADATGKIAIIARMAELNGKCLEWPADIEAAEKADAIQSLAQSQLIVR
nr:head decoration protein [Mesorhizobium sp.]